MSREVVRQLLRLKLDLHFQNLGSVSERHAKYHVFFCVLHEELVEASQIHMAGNGC